MLSYLTGVKGKDTVLIVPDSIPDSIAFITKGIGTGKLIAFDENGEGARKRIEGSDLIICQDCNSFSRTADMEGLLRGSGAHKILIDHHLNPEAESFDLVFSKTGISSASELLFWLKITGYGVAYIILDELTQKRFDFRKGESEGFVNMPLSIASVRMSIFLTQENDILKVSVRSKAGTSANECAARFFNGGGHECAAGGKLTIGKDLAAPSDAEAYILKAAGEFFGI